MELQVGIKAFSLNEKGQFLLLEKNTPGRPHHKGKWDIPGGRIVPGASLMENLSREVLEETGLEIDLRYPPRLLLAQDIIREELHVVRLSYWVHVKGEVVLSDEHLSYRWVNLPEMKEVMASEEGALADAVMSGVLDGEE